MRKILEFLDQEVKEKLPVAPYSLFSFVTICTILSSLQSAAGTPWNISTIYRVYFYGFRWNGLSLCCLMLGEWLGSFFVWEACYQCVTTWGAFHSFKNVHQILAELKSFYKFLIDFSWNQQYFCLRNIRFWVVNAPWYNKWLVQVRYLNVTHTYCCSKYVQFS